MSAYDRHPQSFETSAATPVEQAVQQAIEDGVNPKEIYDQVTHVLFEGANTPLLDPELSPEELARLERRTDGDYVLGFRRRTRAEFDADQHLVARGTLIHGRQLRKMLAKQDNDADPGVSTVKSS